MAPIDEILQAADQKYGERDDRGAEALYRRCVNLDPDCGRAWLGLGSVLVSAWAAARTNEPGAAAKIQDEALRALRTARSLDAEVQGLSLLKEALLLRHSPQQAEAVYRLALECGQRQASAHGFFAEFLTDQGRYEEAEHHFERAVALDPGSFVFLINYGRLQVRREDAPNNELAASLFQRAVALEPTRAEGHYRLGNILGCIPDRLEEAIASLRRALELDPTHVEAKKTLAQCLAVAAENAEETGSGGGETRADRAAERQPALEQWVQLDDAVRRGAREGRRSSRSTVDRPVDAARSGGSRIQDLFRAAEESYHDRDFAQAEVKYRQCLAVDGQHAGATLGLGRLVARRWAETWDSGAEDGARVRLREEAVGLLRKARQLDPALVLWSLMGEALVQRDSPEEAERAFVAALSLDEECAIAHAAYAEFLGDHERYVEAEKHFERARFLERRNPVHYINYGRLEVRRRTGADFELAAFLFRTAAVKVAPDSAEAHFRLGDILGSMPGHLKEAARHLMRALQLDPQHSGARRALDETLVVLAREHGDSNSSSSEELDAGHGAST